jgi:cytoskeleton protein RodZ
MSEAPLPRTESESDQVQIPVTLSAGALLRQAREAAGLHVAALAVSMKVPVKKLEALEADRLDLLPDAVFVRALASSVCRALKIDATQVLQRLPQTAIPRLDTEQRGINEPFHVGGHASQLSMPEFLAKPAVWVVAVLLAGAAVLIAFPEVQHMEKEADSAPAPATIAMPAQTYMEPTDIRPALPLVTASAPVAVTATPPASAPVTAVAAAPVASAPMAMVSSPKPAIQTSAALAVNTSPVIAVQTAKAPISVASAQLSKLDVSTTTIDLASSATGIVVFKVRAPSWVNVVDAKGVVQLRKTLAAGETSGASGALPLTVVIGRADVTNVEVRGKPYSLAGIAIDNVARFEVK